MLRSSIVLALAAVAAISAAPIVGRSSHAAADGLRPATLERTAAYSPARASAAQVKINHIDTVLTVFLDRTGEVVETRSIKVLSEKAVRAAARQVATYIDGVENLEVLAAYTEKSDGTRLAVAPDRILARDAAVDASDGVYLIDQKALTVFYSHVSVGDTVVLKTRLRTRSATFPDQFVTQFLYSRSISPTTASLKVIPAEEPHEIPAPGSTIRIVAPKELDLHVGVYGPGVTDEVTNDEGNTTHHITFETTLEPSDLEGQGSPLDRDPHILVSTFKDFDQLGRAYWAAFSPQTKVTPEIQALADEITKGIEDRRAQAKAISSWVKREIRGQALLSATGREVTTNSAAKILGERYGACTEHVALAASLLAAKGISAEVVLVNLGEVSALPEPPTLAYFNHIILYLPEFGVFDDPTWPVQFGTLVPQETNKPALIVSAERGRIERTPARDAVKSF